MPTGIYDHSVRIKVFCINGHEIVVVGRDKYGNCNQCNYDRKKTWQDKHYKPRKRVPKRFCKKGHDIFIVGRTKANNCKECFRLWEIENKALIILYALKRRNKRNLRVPKFGQDKIKEFCAKIPKNSTVDHIIPLCGKKVSGLHVSWNLQYLTREENDKKNNKIDLLEASEWYRKILEEAGLK